MELIFNEHGLTVKTLSSRDELEAAFRLRHDVFSRELGWVPCAVNGMESDAYDPFSVSIGVFDLDECIVGYLRITPSPNPFMVEKEFSILLPERAKIKKGPDVAEVTRLCVRRENRNSQLMANVANLLYKGLYHWNLGSGVRYSLMVVDNRCYRLLRLTGLPVEANGRFHTMPDGVKAACCTLDWRAFEQGARERKPGFYNWMATVPVRYSSLSLSHELYLQH
ncbi:MAG: GNAT family N-acetyltransferase [Deltaproteobacteria bacterium]|nr:GNAT family N-acetyltransferase [Deltaproteobacteria bacterium]